MNKYPVIFLICLMLLFVASSSAPEKREAIENNLQEITLNNIIQIQLLDSVETAPINEIAWSFDSVVLAVATSEGLWLYNVDSGTLERVINDAVNRVSFVNAENILIDIGNQSVILDVVTFEILDEFPTGFNSVSHNGTMYAVGEVNYVTLYDVQTGTIISEIPVEYSEPCEYACAVQDVVFNFTDTHIAFSSAVPAMQSAIVEIETGDRLPIDVGVLGLSFSPDDTLIVSRAGEPGYLSDQTHITNANNGELISVVELFSFYTDPIFDRAGNLIVLESVDNNAPNIDEAETQILFFDVEELIEEIENDTSLAVNSIARNSKVTTMRFSPNYQILALGEENGDLTLWGIAVD